MHHDEKKQKVVEDWDLIAQPIILSSKDFDFLVNTIKNPLKPTQKLVDAMRKYVYNK
jgi:uncharacterized protein (DUF1778 family)